MPSVSRKYLSNISRASSKRIAIGENTKILGTESDVNRASATSYVGLRESTGANDHSGRQFLTVQSANGSRTRPSLNRRSVPPAAASTLLTFSGCALSDLRLPQPSYSKLSVFAPRLSVPPGAGQGSPASVVAGISVLPMSDIFTTSAHAIPQ